MSISLQTITSQFSGSVMIMTCVGVGLLAGVAFLWQISNLRGSRLRGRRRGNEPEKNPDKRRGDARTLSGPEKRLYAQAKQLMAGGKVQAGARILEQLNMQREAIQSLEDANLVDEAAKILTRMQKHNRAGVVYARHGMWLDAAKSFKLANMPLEVAKCAREAGSWSLAAEHFEAAGRLEDAAEMRERDGDHLNAARLSLQAGDIRRAMLSYDHLPRQSTDVTRMNLQPEELVAIVKHVGDGNASTGLVDIVFQYGKIHDVVARLISNRMTAAAVDLYRRSTSDLGPQLIAEVDYQNGTAIVLAQVFIDAGQPSYAGKVFEHAGDFAQAAECFAKAEEFERAIYCFERAGLDKKAAPLRAKAKLAAAVGSKRKERSGFALSNLPEPSISGAADGEATAVLAVVPMSAMTDEPPREVEDDEPAMLTPPRVPAVKMPARGAFAPDDDDREVARVPTRPTFSMAEDEHDESSENQDAPRENFARPSVAPQIDTLASAPSELAPLTAPPSPRGTTVPSPQSPPPPIPSPTRFDVTTSGSGARSRAAIDLASLPASCQAFHRAKFLSDLDFDQKNALWDIGATKTYAEHAAILTYNDEPEGVYIILSGSVSCFRSVNGKETYVDQMGDSESFGELWLLADQPSAVRFVAAKESEIRVISRDAFNQLMDKDGTLARKVYKRFTLRLLKRLLKPQNPGKIQAAS